MKLHRPVLVIVDTECDIVTLTVLLLNVAIIVNVFMTL